MLIPERCIKHLFALQCKTKLMGGMDYCCHLSTVKALGTVVAVVVVVVFLCLIDSDKQMECYCEKFTH